MKAIIWTKYGQPDGLVLQEVEKPVPKDNEVLIKILATSVFAGDCELRALKLPWYLKFPLRLFFGPRKPRGDKILGQELSGKIEEVGKEVKLYKKGDQVYAAMGFGMGAYAQYRCMSEDPKEAVLALKPKSMSYEEAATIPVGGLNALHFIGKANIQHGHKVLINGAAGSIGPIAIQLAKSFGAEVTAVDSAGKLGMLSSIGADHVIDYTKEDFSKRGEMYDVVFDVVGQNARKNPFSRGIKSVKNGGYYLLANPKMSHTFRGMLTSKFSSKNVISGTVNYKAQDLQYLSQLIENGTIKSPIDKNYNLEQMVDAHAYVDTGQKIGNVSITVSHD